MLKPLYSFAGAGVIVGPTAEQLAAVPAEQRSQYILQERVDFRPVVETPFGPTKMEIRIMYIWLDRLRAVNTIIRMGRGAQMGVDHNKGFEWVGASAGFIDRSLRRDARPNAPGLTAEAPATFQPAILAGTADRDVAPSSA